MSQPAVETVYVMSMDHATALKSSPARTARSALLVGLVTGAAGAALVSKHAAVAVRAHRKARARARRRSMVRRACSVRLIYMASCATPSAPATKPAPATATAASTCSRLALAAATTCPSYFAHPQRRHDAQARRAAVLQPSSNLGSPRLLRALHPQHGAASKSREGHPVRLEGPCQNVRAQLGYR